jgi:hypothetical protein
MGRAAVGAHEDTRDANRTPYVHGMHTACTRIGASKRQIMQAALPRRAIRHSARRRRSSGPLPPMKPASTRIARICAFSGSTCAWAQAWARTKAMDRVM